MTAKKTTIRDLFSWYVLKIPQLYVYLLLVAIMGFLPLAWIDHTEQIETQNLYLAIEGHQVADEQIMKTAAIIHQLANQPNMTQVKTINLLNNLRSQGYSSTFLHDSQKLTALARKEIEPLSPTAMVQPFKYKLLSILILYLAIAYLIVSGLLIYDDTRYGWELLEWVEKKDWIYAGVAIVFPVVGMAMLLEAIARLPQMLASRLASSKQKTET